MEGGINLYMAQTDTEGIYCLICILSIYSRVLKGWVADLSSLSIQPSVKGYFSRVRFLEGDLLSLGQW